MGDTTRFTTIHPRSLSARTTPKCTRPPAARKCYGLLQFKRATATPPPATRPRFLTRQSAPNHANAC